MGVVVVVVAATVDVNRPTRSRHHRGWMMDSQHDRWNFLSYFLVLKNTHIIVILECMVGSIKYVVHVMVVPPIPPISPRNRTIHPSTRTP